MDNPVFTHNHNGNFMRMRRLAAFGLLFVVPEGAVAAEFSTRAFDNWLLFAVALGALVIGLALSPKP